MILIADKDKILLAGEHIYDMRNNRLAINFDQRLWYLVASVTKPFTKARHGDNNLHIDYQPGIFFMIITDEPY